MLNTLIKQALAMQQSQDVAGARKLFVSILKDHPHQPDALHGLGMTYVQEHQFQAALPFLQQAVQVAPWIAEFHNNLGNTYKAIGKTDLAITHYQEALKLKPNYAQAHNNLGVLLYHLGNFKQASIHFEKSLRMDPHAVDTHFNLANCYVQLDRLLDASTHFKETLKLRPDHLSAMHNLGLTLCALKQFPEAKPYLEAVIQRDPNNIDALFHLGIIYNGLAQTLEAKSCYERVIALDPNHAGSQHNLATLYLQLNDPDKALYHYQQALILQPENKTAAHMINALQGKASQAAPEEFTRALFDQYAYSYDQHVKETLKYQVPALLREMITPFVTAGASPWTVLDLGCGTGLCAPLFSDLAGKLIGVDLSPNMIEVAKQRGGYYKLFVMDILTFLQDRHPEFDLIIAADVFVYFGDLTAIFTGIHRALKKDGLFCFSIETLESDDFQLRPTGRFAHHSAYIQALCQRIGFKIEAHQQAIIRQQEGMAVNGDLFVLRIITI